MQKKKKEHEHKWNCVRIEDNISIYPEPIGWFVCWCGCYILKKLKKVEE